MLTRLIISGFKNLVDVDIRFGPFTCIAGANGTGKSNLFDAIRFLSALSDQTLIDAAMSVRDEKGHGGDIRSLFHRVGDQYENTMHFAAEMIIPETGVDDLGQDAKASITFLRYELDLEYKLEGGVYSRGGLELKREVLNQINLSDAPSNLLFPNKVKWRKSAISGRRTSPLISTDKEGKYIMRHQDGSGGRPLQRLAYSLPRTVLSASSAAESPTALMARREMQSWKLLQLEPSALRSPDNYKSPAHLGMDGAHLASTLYNLAHRNLPIAMQAVPDREAESRIYGQVVNSLATLIDDVRRVWVDPDPQRELLTLFASGKDGTPIPARSLSDGTLRFLALSVLELDPESKGLLCLEEPENGIHPSRIPAMLSLLKRIAMDVEEPIGPDNPLRQVIINTHSPAVVAQVPEDSLLIAELKPTVRNSQKFSRASFACLPNDWRTKADPKPDEVAMGMLLSYLNPASEEQELVTSTKSDKNSFVERRVMDREDVRQLYLF